MIFPVLLCVGFLGAIYFMTSTPTSDSHTSEATRIAWVMFTSLAYMCAGVGLIGTAAGIYMYQRHYIVPPERYLTPHDDAWFSPEYRQRVWDHAATLSDNEEQ